MFKLTLPRWPYREDAAFSLLALLVFFVPLIFTVPTYENFETPKWAGFLVLLGGALWAFFSGERRRGLKDARGFKAALFEPNRTSWFFNFALAAFAFFAVLSFTLSSDKFLSFFGYYPRYANSLFFYLAWTLCVWLLFQTVNRERLMFLLKILIFDALLISINGLFQSAGIGLYSGLETDPLVRAPSFTGNPNFSSLFILPAVPLALVFALRARNVYLRLYYVSALWAVLWAVAVFSSRGAILGFVVSLLWLAGMWLGRRVFNKHLIWLIVIGAAAFGFLYLFGPLARPAGWQNTFVVPDSNITARYYVWDFTRQAISRHPVGGLGFGNFYQYYQNFREAVAANQASFDDPHNLFLFLAVTGGIPFVIAFGALLFTACWQLTKAARKDTSGYAAALVAGLIGIAVAASFTPVTIPVYVLIAVLLSGLLLSSSPPAAHEVLPSAKPAVGQFSRRFGWLRWPARIGGIVLILYGIVFLTGEFLFFQGLKSYYNGNYERSIKFTNAAKKIYPLNPSYRLYSLGSKIKLYGDTPEVLADLHRFYQPRSILFRLRSANLDFLLYLKTRKMEYAQAAIAKVEDVLKINPNRAEVHVRLAYYLFDSGGDRQKAALALRQALVLNDRFFPAWLLYAKLYQERNQKEQMVWALERLHNLYPNHRDVKYLLALARKADNVHEVPFEGLANYDVLE